ncbi:aldo/keto reductase [Miltoncostaea marina]|uniref:aldo/keto reductase n=1 Tax=Miltoncostaea marina TaxID=2843215 RepID=UPI001C3C8C19|nr:aldo/keto reductase [Miltoncostaea marina]
MRDPGHVALGSWSGGLHMHFGLPIDEDRLVALLRPGDDIDTVITADAYGAGAADRLVGRALAGLERDAYCLVGAVGHDFYEGTRQGAKGYPRFTDPALRGPEGYAGYLRRATEASLERCGTDRFDLLLLHNPDRVGYTSEVVWDAMAGLRDEGLAGAIGVAPGPANGFTLDLIACFERFGDRIDWAMIILSPFEPWPSRLLLPALQQHHIRGIARVVDHGGVFHGDVPDEPELPERDHRAFRPAGWVAAGRERLARLRPYAERHGLSTLQLACQWTLAQAPVACVVPTLIQEPGAGARPIEAKRADLAGVPREVVLSADEVAGIEAIGENAGCMVLKGGTPAHEGDERADSWPMTEELRTVATRWSIHPERDLVKTH